MHAPTSYASILPPATADEITRAETRLRETCGFGFAPELVSLWELVGGARQLDVEEYDEEGEVATES